ADVRVRGFGGRRRAHELRPQLANVRLDVASTAAPLRRRLGQRVLRADVRMIARERFELVAIEAGGVLAGAARVTPRGRACGGGGRRGSCGGAEARGSRSR